MSRHSYAVGLTISVACSLAFTTWVLYDLFELAGSQVTVIMIGTTVAISSAAVIGYRSWLQQQHTGSLIRFDSRKLTVVAPVAIAIGAAAWLGVRLLLRAPLLGELVVAASFAVTALVLGLMISLRVERTARR